MFATYIPNLLLTSSYHSIKKDFYGRPRKTGSTSVSEQLPNYPSPSPTLTLTCYQLTVVGLVDGELPRYWYWSEKRIFMANPSNLWSGRYILMTSSHRWTFLWKKLPILLTSPILSTQQSGLLVKRNLGTITKINDAVKSKLEGNLHMTSLTDS